MAGTYDSYNEKITQKHQDLVLVTEKSIEKSVH